MRSTSIPSQVRTLVGCHTDLSELIIKPALVNEFDTKVDFSRAFSKVLSILRLSSKKQAIFMKLNLQYFTNGLTTLVKTKGAVDKSNGITVKTNNFRMSLIFHEKVSLVLFKHVYVMMTTFEIKFICVAVRLL